MLFAVGIIVNAQNSLTTGRRPFVYVGTGYSTTNNTGFSGEMGFWGTSKATSYSLTIDIMNNVDPSTNYMVGLKPYFTAFDNGKISYMLYFQPKFNMNSDGLHLNNRVIEIGFNPNYTVNNNILLGLTFGGQLVPSGTFNPFLSCGFVFLK